MAFLTSGGSLVTSSNIVDNEIVNADVNAAAAIDQSKIKGLVGDPATDFGVRLNKTNSYALTTLANQRVTVFATCRIDGGRTVNLKYNGVTKATYTDTLLASTVWVTLSYTEIPGAATQNVTMDVSAGTLTEINMLVFVQKTA